MTVAINLLAILLIPLNLKWALGASVELNQWALLTKLVLYVSPEVAVQDERELEAALMEAMRHSAPSVRLARAEFTSGGVVTVRPVIVPSSLMDSLLPTIQMSSASERVIAPVW